MTAVHGAPPAPRRLSAAPATPATPATSATPATPATPDAYCLARDARARASDAAPQPARSGKVLIILKLRCTAILYLHFVYAYSECNLVLIDFLL